MKLTRKLLCLLLALCMVFTMIPTVARAEEVPGEAETDRIVVPVPEEETDKEFPETGNNRIEIPFQINPLYEGLVNEADLEIPEIPEPDEIVTHAATFQSEENAAKTIRSNMKNRTETYTVYVYSTNSDYNALFLELLNNAVVHTGVGTEGDYLMWHLAGWGGEVEIARSGQGYNYTYTYVTPYYTTAAQEKEMTTAVNNLINSLGIKYKSDYEKVCAVYDWICANVTYDHANLEDSSYTLKFSAYAALVNKTAVCQGYALLFYRLMLELGVDARFIGGDGGGPHAWNIVQLGDYYYTVDATWDAGYTDYKYFLKSTWNFVGHSRDPEFDYWEFHMDHPMAAEDYVHGGTATLDPYISMGYCGTEENGYLNAAWAMMRNGTLLIAGEGATLNYKERELPYWYYWMDHIEKAEISEGITKIGDYAFYKLPSLTAVATASSVEEIGAFTFAQCEALRQLVLSEGLVTIGKSAFYNCKALNEVTFPSTLKAIQERAFLYAGSMTAINLPQGLTTLGSSAFFGCPEVKTVYVPSSVTSIGTYAFSGCPKLEKVELHCGTVREYMFSGCSALTDIIFGNEVNTVQVYAFNNCDALTTVNYPARLGVFNGFSDCDGLVTLSIPEGITEIGEYAFEGCDNLSSVTFPKTLKRINGYAFSECTSLASLPFNEGLEYIGSHAFYTTPVKDLDFPASLTEIQGNAFGSCLGLTKVSIPKTIQTLCGFKNCTNLSELVLEEGLTRIGGSAFWGCTSLKEVKLPSTLTSIGRDAFKFCSNLESIEFPEGLKTIESDAFTGCNKITEVTIPKSVTSLCGFQNCDGLITVNLNNSGVVQGYAFYGCDNLQNINIGTNLTGIESSAFQKCVSLKELTVPANVENLAGFSGCKGLETVHLHNTGSIGGYAFSGCSSLKNIEITHATMIGYNAFGGAIAETITIPATVTKLDDMFGGNTYLKEVIFEGNAPKFYSGTFSDIVATAYYPYGNATWTEDVMQDYGGTITWVSYAPPCTDHTYDAVVTAPTCSERGYTTYTCTNCGESYVGDYTDPVDHSYEDGTCIWCGDETYTAEWKSATTSLNGTIDLNIYVVLSENLMDEEDAFIRFSYGNKVVDVPIAEGVESVSNGVLRYRYSCPMYAKEVSEVVTVQVMKGDEAIGSALEYSIVTYCMNRINKSTNPAQVALCKALLNYAAAAQISLNYNTANLANAQLAEADKILPDGIDVSGYAASNVGSETGIKTKSATLMLESEVSVRVYFTLEAGYDISDFTFTIDGKVVEPQKNSTGWFIETDGIAAKNLDQMMEFSVGGITVTYGPMSYVNSKLTNSKTSADTLNLVKALYAYWQAAEALLG